MSVSVGICGCFGSMIGRIRKFCCAFLFAGLYEYHVSLLRFMSLEGVVKDACVMDGICVASYLHCDIIP